MGKQSLRSDLETGEMIARSQYRLHTQNTTTRNGQQQWLAEKDLVV